MKRHVLLTFAWLLCAFVPAEAATLHAIIAADIEDFEISHSVQHDLMEMHARLQEIAIYADLNLSETILVGKDFRSARVVQTIRMLNVEPDDAVIYYHSGHGFRIEEMPEVWPALYFGPTEHPMRLQSVIELIQAKNPGFTLILADVCNNVLMLNSLTKIKAQTRSPIDDALLREGYKKLFRESRARIVACGALPGQYSVCLPGRGGLFTESFMMAIDQTLANEEVSWDRVAAFSQFQVAKMASYYGIDQVPRFQIE